MRVTQVAGGQVGTTRRYGYDNVGNQITRPGGSVVYNEMNLPARMLDTAKVKTAEFLYGTGGGRVRKITGSGANQVSTTYIGGLYEQIRQGGRVEHRLIVPGMAVLPYVQTGNTLTKQAARFIHTDHLGSTQTVTADDAPAGSTSHKAVVKEIRSYDAFGKTRNPDWTPISYTGVERALATAGYTGHNDDPELGLIDMGGRVYDPTLARFLTPDPSVPEPGWTQAWNPYAYVINNPLRLTDPSGFTYCAECEFAAQANITFYGGLRAEEEGALQFRGAYDINPIGDIRNSLPQFHEVKKAAKSNNLGPGIAKGGVQVAENTMSGVGSDANAGTRTADEIIAQECGPGGMYCARTVTITPFRDQFCAAFPGHKECGPVSDLPLEDTFLGTRAPSGTGPGNGRKLAAVVVETASGGALGRYLGKWVLGPAINGVRGLLGKTGVPATTAPGMRLKTGIRGGARAGIGTRLFEGQKCAGGDCVKAAKDVAKKLSLPTESLVEGSEPGIFKVHSRFPQMGGEAHYAVQLSDGRIVDTSLLGNIETYRHARLPLAERAALEHVDTFTPEQYAALLNKYFQ